MSSENRSLLPIQCHSRSALCYDDLLYALSGMLRLQIELWIGLIQHIVVLATLNLEDLIHMTSMTTPGCPP